MSPTDDTTILIIDDNPESLGIIENCLASHPFETLVARSGERGIEKAVLARPDLILLDVTMPGIDGFETCRRLKQSRHCANIPVIFLTALSDPGDKVRAFKSGAVDFITKPLNREELAARVLTHLRLKELNERLERQVEKRTGELESANRRLHSEIIERKKAEKELRKSAVIIDSTSDAVITTDVNGNIRFWNRGAKRIYGYERNEVVGRPVSILYREEDLHILESMITELMTGNDIPNIELTCINKQGKGVHILLSLMTIKDSNREITELVGLTKDISGMKRSEKKLQELQANLVKAQQITRLGSWEWDIKQNRSICSEEFYRLLGIPSQGGDFSFDNYVKQVHPDDRHRIETAVENALAGREDYDQVHRVVLPDNTVRIHHARAEVIWDGNGKPMKMVGTQHDITEKRMLEARLQKAQKMESIGNLAGGIAHDFNNLLFPIIGMSEMLLEDLPENSPEHDKVKEILKAGMRGGDLVKQILAFSRQSEFKKVPIRIQSVLREVIQLSRSTIPADVEISQDIQRRCGPVLADATQIHQIALNLITNAFHAVEPSGGRIDIRLRETLVSRGDGQYGDIRPGRYALLEISDTGCGIGPEIRNKIFEPYFTTKNKEKGTGLGLAVVYGIVKEHGGDIHLETQVGKGTRFSVFFPLIHQEPVVDEVPEKAGRPEAGNEHILLIDDEEAIVNLQKIMLERSGYAVSAFTDSSDALSAFRSSPDMFDMVITDMTMPGMTGDLLAKEIMSVRPHIPVVICTGFSERLTKARAVEIGVKGVLMKPVVRSEMERNIRQILDGNTDSEAF